MFQTFHNNLFMPNLTSNHRPGVNWQMGDPEINYSAFLLLLSWAWELSWDVLPDACYYVMSFCTHCDDKRNTLYFGELDTFSATEDCELMKQAVLCLIWSKYGWCPGLVLCRYSKTEMQFLYLVYYELMGCTCFKHLFAHHQEVLYIQQLV
jgi:hypothetical protein